MTTQRRVLTLLWVEFFTAYLDRTNIAVAGPTLMKSLAITPQLFGYVLAAFTAGYAVMQVPGGMLADRFGVRRVLVAALLVWSLFTGLTALAASAGALIVIRFCFGLGEGIESGAHFRALGDTFNSRERSTASGILHTSLALGPAIAAPLAAAIIGAYGWQALFVWFAVPGVIVAALVWAFFPKTTGQPRSHAVKTGGNPLQRGPRLWSMFAAYLCFNVAFWGLAGWMPSYLSSERHIELKALGFAASVPYLFGFAGLLVLGWMARTVLYERRAQLVAGAYVLGRHQLVRRIPGRRRRDVHHGPFGRRVLLVRQFRAVLGGFARPGARGFARRAERIRQSRRPDRRLLRADCRRCVRRGDPFVCGRLRADGVRAHRRRVRGAVCARCVTLQR